MKEAEIVIPHLFKCPISLDLFTDPVTLSTGQTYERSNIEKWLSFGNKTCPVTMQKLQDPSMVPNHTLLHFINQWVQMNSLEITDPDFKLAANSLKKTLESHEPIENRAQALRKIQDLPQSCLIQLGFFPLILNLIFRENKGEFSQENSILIEESLVCVLKLLPFSNMEALNMLKEENTLANFIFMFDKGTITIKKNLCNLIEKISSSSETVKLSLILGNTPFLLRNIIRFLEDDYEAAVNAMHALSTLEPNRENLIKEGLVQELLRHISSTKARKTSAKVAMEILEFLLVLESGREAIVNYPKGIDAIVKMVFRYSDHEGSENAVNSLIIVCIESLYARKEAILSGVLSQLLLLMQSQSNERTKSRARMLLKLLRSTGKEERKNA